MQKPPLRILGIDPGYAIVGYGVIDYQSSKFACLEYGAVTTDSKMDFCERLNYIYDSLSLIIKKFNPTVMAVEKLFFTTNQKTAIDVAQARGVIQLCAVKNSLEIFEYTPLQVKSSVVGYGKAEKKQVMQMTKTLLGLSQIPKPDDAADALAIAICHAHTSGSSLSYANLLKMR